MAQPFAVALHAVRRSGVSAGSGVRRHRRGRDRRLHRRHRGGQGNLAADRRRHRRRAARDGAPARRRSRPRCEGGRPRAADPRGDGRRGSPRRHRGVGRTESAAGGDRGDPPRRPGADRRAAVGAARDRSLRADRARDRGHDDARARLRRRPSGVARDHLRQRPRLDRARPRHPAGCAGRRGDPAARRRHRTREDRRSTRSRRRRLSADCVCGELRREYAHERNVRAQAALGTDSQDVSRKCPEDRPRSSSIPVPSCRGRSPVQNRRPALRSMPRSTRPTRRSS